MAIRIRRPAYKGFYRNGYNFRNSIVDPDSQLRQLIKIIDRDGSVSRFNFYVETRLPNKDYRPFDIQARPQVLSLRRGWGTSFWTAVKRAGVVEYDPSIKEYRPGTNFNLYRDMAKFFTKDGVESRLHYSDNVPEGWERYE